MSEGANQSRPSWFFWFMAIYTAWHVVWIAVLAFDFVTHPLAPDPQFGSVVYRLALTSLSLPLALVVSVLVMRRAPGNATGLFLVLWLATTMGALVRQESPLAGINDVVNTGWVGAWMLGLYFPNGRSAIPRFERPVRLLTAVAVVMVAAWAFFQPTMSDLANPYYVPALAPLRPIYGFLFGLLLGAIIVFVLPSLIFRYRNGDERTRQQLRWLAWAYAILLLMFIPLAAAGLIVSGSNAAAMERHGWTAKVGMMVFNFYLAFAPYLAVGNAILRHRLYDIDVIIRKTVVYGAVSGLLALVFYSSILVLQQLFRSATGEQSPVAVVVSTLAIATLFSPLRRRVQDFVDRRFYRRKYDAQQVLARFAAVARDETDLERLTLSLGRTIEETMQPVDLAVALAAPAERKTR